MARKPPTPAEVMDERLRSLSLVVKNLLVDNKNFHGASSAYYFSEMPSTRDFVRGPLKGMAESIVDRIEELRDLSSVMAASPEVPGFVRTIEGKVGDVSVVARSRTHDAKWTLSITHDHAFDSSQDWEGLVEDENAAVAAIQAYLKDGILPVAEAVHSP